MKSLNQAGGSSAGRWSRWVACAAFATAVAGCGGGSDPLGVTDGGGSGGSSGLSENELRSAYDRINQCGLTFQEVKALVGAEERSSTVSWEWYEDGAIYTEKGRLKVSYDTSRAGWFADTGIRRAVYVYYEHSEKGIEISKELCPT